MKVKEIMSKNYAFIAQDSSIKDAAKEMEKTGRGFLVVFKSLKEKRVMGVLSNKDIIDRVVAKNIPLWSTYLSDVMTKKLIHTSPDSTLSEAMDIMKKQSVKRLLVIDKGVMKGIITYSDIFKAMIKHKKELLDMALDF